MKGKNWKSKMILKMIQNLPQQKRYVMKLKRLKYQRYNLKNSVQNKLFLQLNHLIVGPAVENLNPLQQQSVIIDTVKPKATEIPVITLNEIGSQEGPATIPVIHENNQSAYQGQEAKQIPVITISDEGENDNQAQVNNQNVNNVTFYITYIKYKFH